MIPKPLDQIEWADLERLKDSRREEGDTIEFKGSFSGGSDYLNFTDPQRDKAIKGIAREVIAFLNGRGGDVVIGAEEASNDDPRIGSFKPIQDVAAVADRLAQSLAAVIEPYQSIVGVRAIRQGTEAEGVIVVRAPQSLRAPHRLTKDKECYIRRGRESVPMPMDEIHDLTLRRTATLKERVALLDREFYSLSQQKVGRCSLPDERVHFRMCWVPSQNLQILLSEDLLSRFRGDDPLLTIGGRTEKLDVAFRNLRFGYDPILRGKQRETLTERAWSDNDFEYVSKIIREDGVMRADYACRAGLPGQSNNMGFHSAWAASFFANVLNSFSNVAAILPGDQRGIIRFAVYGNGPMDVHAGEGMWAERATWPSGVHICPDFEIDDLTDILAIFEQLQSDVGDIAGIRHYPIYKFAAPQ